MEVMIHFLFTLVKITLQAATYAAIVYLLFRFLASGRKDGWWNRVSASGSRFYPTAFVLCWISLFFFLFSYRGFHGLGDGPRVPIGHDLFVDNTNWTEYGYIEEIRTSDGHGLEMTRFLAVDDHLMGNLDSWFDTYSNAFFIYDMEHRSMHEFSTETEFNAFASAKGLPHVKALRTFEQNYDDRWGGWWFWLLP